MLLGREPDVLLGIEMPFQLIFSHISGCLPVNSLQGSFIEMMMIRYGKRLPGAICQGSREFDVAAFLPDNTESENGKYSNDVLAGQDFQLRHEPVIRSLCLPRWTDGVRYRNQRGFRPQDAAQGPLSDWLPVRQGFCPESQQEGRHTRPRSILLPCIYGPV